MKSIEVKALSFTYENKIVLSDITFDVQKGEVFGIIGPNGSGKTTLMKAMSNGLIGFHGDVLIHGKSIKHYDKKQLARTIAFVEQEGNQMVSFTVEEVLEMGRYPWIKPFEKLSEKDDQIIEAALISLDILNIRKKRLSQLSGGERQLVSLARAIVQQPQILFLDEPTTYLDISNQLQIMKNIQGLKEEHGLTVVMVLHDINLAAQFCDRLLLLSNHRVQGVGTVSEIVQGSKLEKVYNTKTILVEHPIHKVPQILLSNG